MSILGRLFGERRPVLPAPLPAQQAPPCPRCGATGRWHERPVYRLVNPHGEFVEGYGHSMVMKQIGGVRYCVGCGWEDGGNPTIITRAEMEAM